MATEQHPSSHPDPKIAYHFDWEFRHEAALWVGDRAFAINFHPLASELRAWLLRQGNFSIFTEEHRSSLLSLTNPYAYHASVIAAILANSVNASYDFANSEAPIDAMDAEVERVRLYNELVLYTARFCEASIKQLLYCTQIPEYYYKTAALGALLSSECHLCKSAGKPRHKVSMLGSLAHRYHLCLEFEHCLFEHLKIVNRRRNIEAAHSETQALRPKDAAESKAALSRDTVEVGNELVHMLQHISDLESRMIGELKERIAGRPHAAQA